MTRDDSPAPDAPGSTDPASADTPSTDAAAPDAASPESGSAGGSAASAGGTRRGGLGRRGLFGAAGAGLVAGGLLGYSGGRAAAPAPEAAPDPLQTSYPFRGEHQQGIVTPAQDYMFTAAYDVSATSLADLRELMSTWQVASEQMCAGELVGGQPLANRQAAPRDTGEAWGYPPSSLTFTVGVGPSLFRDEDGRDRFGLASRATEVLTQGVPRFTGDALREAQSDGDLVVQACADDAQVAMHAIRNLTRLAFGTAALRWTQIGYGRTSSTSTQQETPRNLFGFKDGTSNMKAEDGAQELAEHLWVGSDDDGADWLRGGTYLMIRKIRMELEVWDRLRLLEQEDIIGRDKRYGAPLSVADPTSSSQEFTDPDLAAGGSASPLIPVDAHIRMVSPDQNDGARMLRRGYNYTDGSDSLGRLDAGLFFEAFVRDPRTGFYPILDRMTKQDALSEYLQHVASGLFAILPGVAEGETMFGQALFGEKSSSASSDGGSASDGG
ncbi:Dyp-type peroxidase [Brachybacterium halotolerans subsp. kimchii]|uniref:Dyp-type peroxidase n=1 Tax=Brachybacterium halotolerans TaxID=2795215 RepID=UPI001E645058|nr:Dyp-type peroxidase [Brachybacterium halotolerans]UEJ83834.1 Dyp-type peroxidase [Brachybacterium halotolerans subsp. kimchii]